MSALEDRKERLRLLRFATALAREAGALLRARFDWPHHEREKDAREIVTEVDVAAERLLVERLRSAFPTHYVVAEEGSGQEGTSAYRWYVDPLDGTHNYAHGYPHFCVSLALWHEQEPVLGVVYDPMRDECFQAARDFGAWLNGLRIRVSRRRTLDQSLVSTGFPYGKEERADNNLAEFSRVALRVQGIRRSGVAALDLCYVAAGRQEAHWEIGLKPWDVAAGGLLVLEAGGHISGPANRPWSPHSDRLVASNGRVHQELLALLGWH